MPQELTRLNADQIHALPRDKTVFFFPVGPIEDHGPHLPVGLDLLEASALCRQLAERLEKDRPGWVGVVFPTAPLGIDSDTTALKITVRPHVLRDWLVDACRSLRKSGFRHFACYSGHRGPRQLTAIEEAGKVLRRSSGYGLFHKASLISLSSALVDAKEVKHSPCWPDPAEHAGETDTSIALAVASESVAVSFSALPPHELEATFLGRALLRARHRLSGYWGSPSKAHANKGSQALLSYCDRIYSRLTPHLDGKFAPSAFRTWYSIVPTNRSFFKAWIMALLILILLGLWTSMTLKGYS